MGETTFLVMKNRAYSTLATAIDDDDTSVVVAAGEGARFPSTYPFDITIEDEIMQCTNRSTDTLTVTRAQQSTTAAAHSVGIMVALNITAKSITDLNTAVNFIEKYADYGLAFYGAVTTYTDTTHFKVSSLAGLGASTFLPVAGTPYEIYVFKADGAAPQGEQTPVVAYTTVDGTFQHAAFSVILAVDDEVLILHPLLASLGTKATAAASGAVTTTDYLMAYVKQILNEILGTDGAWTNLSNASVASLDVALQAIGRVLAIDSTNQFSGSLDGSARTTLEAMWVALGALIGTRAEDAATGAVGTTKSGIAYIKQLVTELQVVDGIVDKVDDVLIPTAAVHFWVDLDGGSDSNGGLSPADPVLTITHALDLCTAGRYDVIHIMSNSPSSPSASETFPIVIDKQGVTIQGEYGSGILSDSGIGSDEQNVATFQIKAHYVTIQDLYIGCDQLGTTGGLIEFYGTSSYFGCAIKRCTFDTQYVPAYGVKVDYDQPYLLVEDCIFGRSGIGGYTTAGIYIGNLTAGMIRRNIFRKCAGIGILTGAQAYGFDILENRFSLPSDTAGKAITLADGSSGIYVDGNRANFGDTNAMSNNPFVDSNADDSNNWGFNQKGGGIIDSIEAIRADLGDVADTATSDDLSDIATTTALAKLRRLLLRFSANAFSATIGGAAKTDIENMVQGLANYISASGGAYSVSLDGSARTDIEALHAALAVMLGTRDNTPSSGVLADTESIFALLRRLATSGSLVHFGDITAIDAGVSSTIADLIGWEDDYFLGWWMMVVRDDGGAGAAPQGEYRQISSYTSTTGLMNHTAFSAADVVGDQAMLIHPLLYKMFAATAGSGPRSLETLGEDQDAGLDVARGTSGAVTVDGGEDDLYDESSDTEFVLLSLVVDLNNMAEGDSMVFKVYTTEDGVERKISRDEENTYIDAQDPARVPIISSSKGNKGEIWGREGIRVCAVKLGGTSRAITAYWRDAKRGS